MNDVDTYMPALDDPDGHASAVAEFTFARRSRRLGAIGAALAIFFLWFGLPAIRNAAPPTPTAQTAAHSAALNSVAHHTGPPAKRIEDIQLGDRVAGRNPHREEVELVEPDEESWREVRLRLKKDDGGLLWINLLRPIEWLEIQEAQVGGEIFLDLPEMGAVGDAAVLELLPCPKIDAGNGAVVTGQFRHEVTNGEIVELRLAGQTTPTRVTANHPYWSINRDDFIPAGELTFGERLDTLDGDASIASLTRVAYSGLLYNLETTEHVYRVDATGTLVHNAYPLGAYKNVGGHHIFAQSAFKGLGNYSSRSALALGTQQMERLGIRHLGASSLTTTQHRLFQAFARSGKPNTLAAHAAIARRVLIEHGVSPSVARRYVSEALQQLKSWGIASPTHIPWGG